LFNPILGILASSGAVAGGSYESIATALGTGSSGVITFSSIPSTYKHLQIRLVGFQATNNDIFIKVNSDAGVRQHWIMGNGSSATAGTNTGTGDGQYFGTTGFPSTTDPSAYIIDFLDYGSTTKAKTVRTLGGYDSNGSGRIHLLSHLFTTTSAISSITFTSGNSYSSNSQFALYGIKD
jgi:hypothetical protein